MPTRQNYRTSNWLPSDQKRGFTLIELLAVITVIALLMSIMVPALNTARARARDVACTAHLRQIGIYLGVYSHAHNGMLPPSAEFGNWPFAGGRRPSGEYDFSKAVPTALGSLWATGIVDDWSFLYCPSARNSMDDGYLTKELVFDGYWPHFPDPPQNWWRAYTGFMYWVGWEPDPAWAAEMPPFSVENLRRGAAQSGTGRSTGVTVSCPIITTLGDTGNWEDVDDRDRHAWASHTARGRVRGGNIVRLDGSAEWTRMAELLEDRENRIRLVDRNARFLEYRGLVIWF